MYYKDIESSALAKAVHNSNQAKWASERLKKVAALRKMRKGSK